MPKCAVGALGAGVLKLRLADHRRIILVIEDEALVGFDLTDTLDAAGYMIAGPANSSVEALRWLDQNKPDIAILDVMLKDGPSVEIARELRAREIPFMVYSGHRQKEADQEFQDVRWLEKPAPYKDLLNALDQLLAGTIR